MITHIARIPFVNSEVAGEKTLVIEVDQDGTVMFRNYPDRGMINIDDLSEAVQTIQFILMTAGAKP